MANSTRSIRHSVGATPQQRLGPWRRWTMSGRIKPTNDVAKAIDSAHAAQSGRLELLEWLATPERDGFIIWTADVKDVAARYGHMHLIKWLHTHRTEGCTEEELDHVASYGHLHNLRWLHAHYPICDGVIFEGWCKKGVGWIEVHSRAASRHGQDEALYFAVYRGHLDIVRFLTDRQMGGDISHAFETSATTGHFAIARWIYEQFPQECDVEGIRDIVQRIFRDDPEVYEAFEQMIHEASVETRQAKT